MHEGLELDETVGIMFCANCWADYLGNDKEITNDPQSYAAILKACPAQPQKYRRPAQRSASAPRERPGPVKTPIWKKINQKDEVKRYDNSDFRESVSRAMKMTEKMEQAGCEPSVIAERALSIIENSKNKTRYRIDPTRIQNIMLQLFPKRVADRMIAKRMKIINK